MEPLSGFPIILLRMKDNFFVPQFETTALLDNISARWLQRCLLDGIHMARDRGYALMSPLFKDGARASIDVHPSPSGVIPLHFVNNLLECLQ